MKYQQYESEKRKWIQANPGATPREYDKAMQEIAKRLGI